MIFLVPGIDPIWIGIDLLIHSAARRQAHLLGWHGLKRQSFHRPELPFGLGRRLVGEAARFRLVDHDLHPPEFLPAGQLAFDSVPLAKDRKSTRLNSSHGYIS